MSVPQALLATGTTYEAQFVDVSNVTLSARHYLGQPLIGPFSNVFANSRASSTHRVAPSAPLPGQLRGGQAPESGSPLYIGIRGDEWTDEAGRSAGLGRSWHVALSGGLRPLRPRRSGRWAYCLRRPRRLYAASRWRTRRSCSALAERAESRASGTPRRTCLANDNSAVDMAAAERMPTTRTAGVVSQRSALVRPAPAQCGRHASGLSVRG